MLKGGAFVTEKNAFERPVTNIVDGSILGYKYFDFGDDYGSKTMEFSAQINGCGCDSILHILIDSESGDEIGSVKIGHDSGVINTAVKAVIGVHSIFFKVSTEYADGWTREPFITRCLFELKSFVFMK